MYPFAPPLPTADDIPRGARIEATELVRGTAFRIGLLRCPRPLNFAQRAANRLADLFRRPPLVDPAPLVLACDLRPDDYGAQIRAHLAPRLRSGEEIHAVLVGYDGRGRLIAAPRAADRGTDLRRAYGASIAYTYGCASHGEQTGGRPPRRPDAPLGTRALAFPAPPPRYRVYVHRVVQDGRDLPPDEVRLRALALEVEPVPLLGAWSHASAADTLRRCTSVADGEAGHLPSSVDPRHPREGAMLRAVAPGYDRAIKVRARALADD